MQGQWGTMKALEQGRNMITKQRADYYSHFPLLFLLLPWPLPSILHWQPGGACENQVKHVPPLLRTLHGSHLMRRIIQSPSNDPQGPSVLPPIPSLPSPAPTLPPSLCPKHTCLLPAIPQLRAFALAFPTAWKTLPLMAPSLTSYGLLPRCHLLSEAVPDPLI